MIWNLLDATRIGPMWSKQRTVFHALGLVYPLIQGSETREEMDEEADCWFGNYGNVHAPVIYKALERIRRAFETKMLACEEAGKQALIRVPLTSFASKWADRA